MEQKSDFFLSQKQVRELLSKATDADLAACVKSRSGYDDFAKRNGLLFFKRNMTTVAFEFYLFCEAARRFSDRFSQ